MMKALLNTLAVISVIMLVTMVNDDWLSNVLVCAFAAVSVGGAWYMTRHDD